MGLFRKRTESTQWEPDAPPPAPLVNADEAPLEQPPSAASAGLPEAVVPEEPADPEMALTAKRAQVYAAACADVVAATNACLEVANAAVGARNAANTRPQHEISIKHFMNMADRKDQEFPPLYREFVSACSAAKDAAASLLDRQAGPDPEFVLMVCTDDGGYTNTGTARHIMLAEFGATPAAFLEGLERANAAMQADVMGHGEEGFQGRIYSPPAPAQNAERTCPWCAETIKAAAVVCRFCNRDVATSPNALPN